VWLVYCPEQEWSVLEWVVGRQLCTSVVMLYVVVYLKKEGFLFMNVFLNSHIKFMKELNIVIFYSVQSFVFLCRV
jgi:hypothetical protein